MGKAHIKAKGDRSLRRAFPLMADGRIRAKALITRRFPLTDINEAIRAFMERKGGAIKAEIHPHAIESTEEG